MSGGVYRLNGYNSVRRINTRRVVSAGGFVPTDIAGCVLWLDFSDADTMFVDAGTTKVSADGQAIYQMNDKSGNNNHIAQTTLANQPKYKINIKNGLSAGYFEDAGRLLKNKSTFSQSLGATLVITMSFGSSGNVATDMGKNRFSFRRTTVYNGAYLSHSDLKNTTSVCTVTWDTTTHIYINGDLNNSGDAGTASATGIGIGARYDLYNGGEGVPGYYYEVLLYNTVLSDTDRQSVETYLNNKWAIY